MTSASFPLTFPILFDDAYDNALARLKNRFTTPYYTEEGGNIDKLMQIRAAEIEELSHVMDDTIAAHKLSEATKYSLDQWGVMLQLARNTGETDDHYRARLMTQSLVKRRSATPQDMVSTCAGILGTTTDRVTFADGSAPASFDMSVFLSDIEDAGMQLSEFGDIVKNAKAGGVGISMVAIGSFECRGIGDTSNDTKGYNDIANTNPNGGVYSGVI